MTWYVVTRVSNYFHVVEQLVVEVEPESVKNIQDLHLPPDVYVSRLSGAIGEVIVTFRDRYGRLSVTAMSDAQDIRDYILELVKTNKLYQLSGSLYVGEGKKYPTFVSFQKIPIDWKK